MAAATLTLIGLGLTVASHVTKAIGQKKAGDAAKKAGDAAAEAGVREKALEDYNAAAAETLAKDAVARGDYDAQRFRSGVRTLIGSQRAAFAGQGVDVGVGSAVDVQQDAAFFGSLDALMLQENAAREAFGYKVEAENARRRGDIAVEQGKNEQKAGKAASTAGKVGAAGTLLGGGSAIADRYGFSKGRA